MRASTRFDFVREGEGEEGTEKLDKGTIGCYLPKNYLAEPQLRIDFYRRIANAAETKEIKEIEQDLRDRFGKPPSEARALLAAAEIRCLAEARGIVSVETQGHVVRCRLAQPGKTGAYVRLGRRFPRMTAKTPTLKLKELRKILKLLPDE